MIKNLKKGVNPIERVIKFYKLQSPREDEGKKAFSRNERLIFKKKKQNEHNTNVVTTSEREREGVMSDSRESVRLSE